MTPWLYALIAAGGNLLGGAMAARGARRGARVADDLLAFGAGYMVAVVLLALLPAAHQALPGSEPLALVGYLLVHLSQHGLPPHFHFGKERHAEAMTSRWVGTAAVLGLSVHTLFDGVAIGSSAVRDPALGFLVFLAVLLHKVPEGVTVGSVLLASGHSPRAAIAGAGALGAATVVGAAGLAAWRAAAAPALALSAGVALYVAASNLVPEVQQRRGRATLACLAGVALYAALWWALEAGR